MRTFEVVAERRPLFYVSLHLITVVLQRRNLVHRAQDYRGTIRLSTPTPAPVDVVSSAYLLCYLTQSNRVRGWYRGTGVRGLLMVFLGRP